MSEAQNFYVIEPSELIGKATEFKRLGYRFIQCAANRLDEGIEITYTFDNGGQMMNYRFILPQDGEVESISNIYPSALIFENEYHDLFGVKVNGLLIDFLGNFFTTVVDHPMTNKQPFRSTITTNIVENDGKEA